MRFGNTSIYGRLKRLGSPPPNEEAFKSAVAISDMIFKMDHLEIVVEKLESPRHEKSHSKETIYLPADHVNQPIFEYLKSELGEGFYQRFVACHEFGHAAQVACLDRNNQAEVQIKGSSSLNYLFNGTAIPDKSNNFLKELFKEGFADCYAGLCLFKETQNPGVFKQISEIRGKRYHELKREFGSGFIHPNFNVHAAENFGKAVSVLAKQGQDIFALPFTGAAVSIEGYIERAVIAGCLKAVADELRTNDAFLGQFRRFARGFKLDDQQVRRLLAGQPSVDEIVAYESRAGVASFFLEFRNRLPKEYVSVLPDQVLTKVLKNDTYRRGVDFNLVLRDVVAIPYATSSGLESVKQKVVVLRTADDLSEGRSSLPTHVTTPK